MQIIQNGNIRHVIGKGQKRAFKAQWGAPGQPAAGQGTRCSAKQKPPQCPTSQ